MTRIPALAAALAAALLPAAVPGRPVAALGEETYIPFPQAGIRSWHADDDRTLWVIDQRRRWYRVDLMRPCVGLPYAYSLHFETRGLGRFDRTSTIHHQGQRCPVRSVVRSGEPPTRKQLRQAKQEQPGA